VKNVTITVDEEVARWARVEAAKRDISLARFVGELLRQQMDWQEDYERAMRSFLRTKPGGGSGGEPLPSREEVHDRAALRR
jgi:hypothetical protein